MWYTVVISKASWCFLSVIIMLEWTGYWWHYSKMWLDLPKGVLYVHSFKSHFSPPLDRYNNRLTVHANTIAKASTICFYWGLSHWPVWRPLVLGWSVNSSTLPSQADNRQGIITRLAGETGHQCIYMWSWKWPELKSFGHKKFLYQRVPPLRGSPPPPTLHPYRNACGIDYLVK